MTVYHVCRSISERKTKGTSFAAGPIFSRTYELGKETRADDALLRFGYGITCFRDLSYLVAAFPQVTAKSHHVVYECETTSLYDPEVPRLADSAVVNAARSLNITFESLVDAITSSVWILNPGDTWPPGTKMTAALTPKRIVSRKKLLYVRKKVFQ